MQRQQIPNYKTAFKDALWNTKESSHYVFHYMQDSVAEREIQLIETTQENAYEKITKFLGLNSYPRRKIFYYLYPDTDAKERLMGSPWFAQSVYDDFAVHALYTEEHRAIGPHEDTHLLSLPLGLSIGFLQEGLAEYMAGQSWHGESFERVVQDIRANPAFIISKDLLTKHNAWRETDDTYAQQYYALAALFTSYLIVTFDKEKYFVLYKALSRDATKSENAQKYDEIFSLAPDVLYAQFLSTITKI